MLLSGTPVDETDLAPRLRQADAGFACLRLSARPRDTILSFAAAERFAQELADAGLAVTWFAPDGGHEFPAQVIAALNTFLAPILRAR